MRINNDTHIMIINDETREEIYGTEAMSPPYRTNSADIADFSRFPTGSYPWHWHTELEVFIVRGKALRYRIPGDSVVYEQGDVGLVNSNVLHATECVEGESALQEMHLFHPSLIGGVRGGSIERELVAPLTGNHALPLIRFKSGTDEAARCVELLSNAAHYYESKPFGWQIFARNSLSELWLLFLAVNASGESRAIHLQDEERLRSMLDYIHRNYQNKITLNDLSKAAAISQRECCRCFERQIGLSPVQYVIDYRIRKACELLLRSDESVSQIAERTGFSSASYFTEIFRGKAGCSPREFRKRGKTP